MALRRAARSASDAEKQVNNQSIRATCPENGEGGSDAGSRRCRSGLGRGSPRLSPLRGDDLGAALPAPGWGLRDGSRTRRCYSPVLWACASRSGGSALGSASMLYWRPEAERAPPPRHLRGSVHGALCGFRVPSQGRVGGERGLPTGEPLPRALQGGLGDDKAIRRDSCASVRGLDHRMDDGDYTANCRRSSSQGRQPVSSLTKGPSEGNLRPRRAREGFVQNSALRRGSCLWTRGSGTRGPGPATSGSPDRPPLAQERRAVHTGGAR